MPHKNTEHLSTGALSKKLGIKLTPAQLIDAGNTPAFKTHIGCYWSKSDLPSIVKSLISLLQAKLNELENADES